GTMTRRNVERLLRVADPSGGMPDKEVDLLDPHFQAPPDGSEPLVEGSPVRVSPDCTVKDAYLLMKVAESDGVLYVTDRGILQG
ncbi:PSL4, partial [Symbiodinium pilosum]